GKFCDEEQVMCDGTNSFWCEHGGVCEEIIQGENYTCKCSPGYIGEHCQHSGTPCGNIFCFHQAECIEENSWCACPPHWRGSVDCSLPTQIEHTLNDATPSFVTTNYRGGGNEWLVPFVSVVIVVGVLGSVISWTKRIYYKKRKADATKFQQLSQRVEFVVDTVRSFIRSFIKIMSKSTEQCDNVVGSQDKIRSKAPVPSEEDLHE
ncbi:hypothetical protein KI387_036231, partial [Taxus chinensis]